MDVTPPRPFPDLVTEDEVFTFSASGISTARGCGRKAVYRYVNGISTEPNASAKLGTAIHSEMERWYLEKVVPEIAATRRLLPLAPNPTHPGVHVERPFRILLPVGAARGFKDLLVERPESRLMPTGYDWSPERPAVFDWKSTSNLIYAKTEDDLVKDPQAILYGAAARLAVARKVRDVPEVDLQWTYTSTKRNESRPVRVRQTLTILEDGLAEVIQTATEMRQTFADAASLGEKGVNETPYDLRECEKYGGCPHREYCTAFQHFASFGSGPTVGLDPPEAAVTLPVATPPAALRRKDSKMVESNTLARLRNAGKTPPKAAAPEAPPAAATEAAPEAVKPSPEPPLPKPDTSGLDTPLPPGSSPINSAEASPNVSPTDPPAPGGDASPAPKRGGRKAPKAPDVVEVPQYVVGDLRATVSAHMHKAVADENFPLAAALVEVLIRLGGR
jgi:hypothetical protein